MKNNVSYSTVYNLYGPDNLTNLRLFVGLLTILRYSITTKVDSKNTNLERSRDFKTSESRASQIITNTILGICDRIT